METPFFKRMREISNHIYANKELLNPILNIFNIAEVLNSRREGGHRNLLWGSSIEQGHRL